MQGVGRSSSDCFLDLTLSRQLVSMAFPCWGTAFIGLTNKQAWVAIRSISTTFTCRNFGICVFFTFLTPFRLLAHELFFRDPKNIICTQHILMVGNSKYKKMCEKQIFKKYNFQNFSMKCITVMRGMWAMDWCAVCHFCLMDGAGVSEISADTGQVMVEEYFWTVGSCVVPPESL